MVVGTGWGENSMRITSTRRLFIAGTGVIGSTAALAACFGEQSGAPWQDRVVEPDGQAPEDAATLASTAWERMAYDDVPQGGSITEAILTFPANWNRHQVDGNDTDTARIARPCGADAEISYSETGEKTLNPDYVESAEIISQDPQTVAFRYNPDAVWEDGSPIVVDDLIAQWKALDGSNQDFSTVTTVGWDQIASITRTDDEFSGEIVYSAPYLDWALCLHPESPAEVFADAETFNTGYISEPTPSKGPFRVGDLDEAAGMITLVPNENWWGRVPKLEQLVFQVVDQPVQPQSFADGEIDLIEISTGEVLSQARTRYDATIQRTDGLAWTHLTLNTQGGDGALEDVRVREAIARGIDRDAIGRAVLGPLESPVVLVDNFVYMPGQDGYEDSFGGLEFDPEAAGALLDEAGWVLEGVRRTKDGETLDLSIIIPADTPSNSDRARQIQTNLNSIGVTVELRTVPAEEYFPDHVQPTSFDLVTFSWIGAAHPESSSANLLDPLESGQNYTNFADDRVGLLNERLKAASDVDERHRLANEISTIIAESFVIIPLYSTPQVWGVKETIVNYGASRFESTDWTQVGLSA